MSTKIIDTTVFSSFHPDIVKRTSVSGLITSSALLIIGVLMFVSTFEFEDKSSAISMSLMVFGIGLFLLGVFRMFWKSKAIVYLPTGSLAKKRSIFFNVKHLDKLTESVNSGLFVHEGIKSESSGNLRMDVILSNDKKFVAVQLFQFIPYTYQPVTAVRYFKNEDALSIASFLSGSE